MRTVCCVTIGLAALLLAVCSPRAHADVSLLVEEPFGNFGAMNPTGHAAIYLHRVCAETPTRLRRCGPGEMGVVISRYHRINGYDWLAVPILPYLYAVENAEDVPATATPDIEAQLRDIYRRRHLEEVAPDLADGSAPGGEWYQLVGASYDRTIYGFTVVTTEEQDEQLIARFNERRNVSHFNLFFNNCADLSRGILDFYYPKSVRRSFLADFGFTTPKHMAERLTHYGKRHEVSGFSTFVIAQVPGSIPRSTRIRGVAESLIKTKKYLVPLALWHPAFTGGLAVAYLTRGRFTMPKDAVPLSAENFVSTPEVNSVAADIPPASLQSGQEEQLASASLAATDAAAAQSQRVDTSAAAPALPVGEPVTDRERR